MKMKVSRWVARVSLCLLGTGIHAAQETKHASSSPKKEKSTLFAVQQFEQVALSPDGKHVAWIEIRTDNEGSPTGKKDIFINAPSGTGKPVRLTAGPPAGHFDEGGVAWSPDSKRIALLSDAAKSGQLQLYISGLNGTPAQKLTGVKGFLQGA